jgi:hypothetical protein
MTFFELKDSIDNVMYGVFNRLSLVVFLFRFKTKRLVRANRRFKGIHAGERCFILGTGPSLKALSKDQLEKLKKEAVFGSNSLYKADILDGLTPTYYALFDNAYWAEMRDTFTDVIQKYQPQSPVFLTDWRAENLIRELGMEVQTLFLYSKKYPINSINSRLDKNMYIGHNVVNISILAAIYMGFKEIYLLGCDYSSFLAQENNHCYDDADEVQSCKAAFRKQYKTLCNLGFYLKAYANITRIHYLIAEFARKKGVKIINITPNSLLDAYPRKDISTVL